MTAPHLLALLLLFSPGAFSAEGDPAKRLASAKYFAFGSIDLVGTPSDEELAFREILASPSAEADFLRVLQRGDGPAKCYALLGLRLKNRAVFEERAKEFTRRRDPVQIRQGCMGGYQEMWLLLGSIRRGLYDHSAQREMNP